MTAAPPPGLALDPGLEVQVVFWKNGLEITFQAIHVHVTVDVLWIVLSPARTTGIPLMHVARWTVEDLRVSSAAH